MIPKKKSRVVWQATKALMVVNLVAAVVIAVYGAGFYTATNLAAAKLEEVKAAAYQAGLASQDWKELAKSEQKYADKLCTAWWFGLTHKDRNINLNGKPKRL